MSAIVVVDNETLDLALPEGVQSDGRVYLYTIFNEWARKDYQIATSFPTNRRGLRALLRRVERIKRKRWSGQWSPLPLELAVRVHAQVDFANLGEQMYKKKGPNSLRPFESYDPREKIEYLTYVTKQIRGSPRYDVVIIASPDPNEPETTVLHTRLDYYIRKPDEMSRMIDQSLSELKSLAEEKGWDELLEPHGNEILLALETMVKRSADIPWVTQA